MLRQAPPPRPPGRTPGRARCPPAPAAGREAGLGVLNAPVPLRSEQHAKIIRTKEKNFTERGSSSRVAEIRSIRAAAIAAIDSPATTRQQQRSTAAPQHRPTHQQQAPPKHHGHHHPGIRGHRRQARRSPVRTAAAAAAAAAAQPSRAADASSAFCVLAAAAEAAAHPRRRTVSLSRAQVELRREVPRQHRLRQHRREHRPCRVRDRAPPRRPLPLSCRRRGCCLSAVAASAAVPTATVCCLRPSLPLPFVLLLRTDHPSGRRAGTTTAIRPTRTSAWATSPSSHCR
jgi:hypothetical protein